MKRKNLFLVLALMGTALTGGSAMASDGSGCTSCATAAPIMAGMQGATRATGGDGQEQAQPVRSCCDPVLANINMKTLFSQDLAPGGNLTSNYGLNFNPTPAFNTAFDNTAFMVAVMAGVNPYGWNWLVMTEEMKTDNVPGNTVWPSPISNGWTGASIAPNPGWLAWNQTPPSTPTSANSPHKYTAVNASGHMRPDGTVYVMKVSFWLYTNVHGQGWVKRPVYCNNVPDRFVGIRLNTANMKLAPGSKPALDMVSQDANQGMANARIQVGAALKLSQAEIDALPAQIKAAAR